MSFVAQLVTLLSLVVFSRSRLPDRQRPKLPSTVGRQAEPRNGLALPSDRRIPDSQQRNARRLEVSSAVLLNWLAKNDLACF